MDSVQEIRKYNQVSYIDKDLDYKSGIIVDDNVAWCLFSSFDSFNTPDIMVHKEANKSKNLTYVGLIHGDVNGAITTTNYVTDNGLDPKVFDGCDFVIAGHIHKRQEIKKNGIPIVYCSSLKQQNF
jgi:DNA repair exonuclease SbcCD nuclease subunit